MRWRDHFAMASAGTLVLYRLNHLRGDNVYVVMSAETAEPVTWIVSREKALGWMVVEACMSIDEARCILWGSDEWAKHNATVPAASDCPAE